MASWRKRSNRSRCSLRLCCCSCHCDASKQEASRRFEALHRASPSWHAAQPSPRFHHPDVLALLCPALLGSVLLVMSEQRNRNGPPSSCVMIAIMRISFACWLAHCCLLFHDANPLARSHHSAIRRVQDKPLRHLGRVSCVCRVCVNELNQSWRRLDRHHQHRWHLPNNTNTTTTNSFSNSRTRAHCVRLLHMAPRPHQQQQQPPSRRPTLSRASSARCTSQTSAAARA